MSKNPHSDSSAANTNSNTQQYSEREVDGVFLDREQLDRAVSALVAAGFKFESMAVVLERRVHGGGSIAASNPKTGFTAADERQLRTLGTSLAGAVGALAAAGVTLLTGGAAAVVIAAAALVGVSAATGVHVFKTSMGFDGSGPPNPDRPDEDVILSVRVGQPGDESRVAEIFQKYGAEQIWAQQRPY